MSEPSSELKNDVRVEVRAQRERRRVAGQRLGVGRQVEPGHVGELAHQVLGALPGVRRERVDDVAEPAVGEAEPVGGRGVGRQRLDDVGRGAPVASRNCPLRLLSPAISSSMAPSLNRSVAAMPLKSRNLSLRSSAIDELGSCGVAVHPDSCSRSSSWSRRRSSRRRRRRAAAHQAEGEAEQRVGVVGEVVAGRRAGVERHDPGVTGLVGPVLEVVVVGQRALLGRRDDLVGDVVGLGDDRPVALDRPADVVAAAAVLDLVEAGVGLVGVLDLDHDHRVGVLAAQVDGRERGPLTEPGLDVVGVVDVVAAAPRPGSGRRSPCAGRRRR